MRGSAASVADGRPSPENGGGFGRPAGGAVEGALAAWREAERRRAEATPATLEYVDAVIAVEDARSAYASIAAERFDVIGQLDERMQEFGPPATD